MARARLAFKLLELAEDHLQPICRDARTGIGNNDLDGIDAEADAAGIGELHRVADEIEQDLPQAVAIADELRRQFGRDIGGKLDALGLRPRRHQLRDGLDELHDVEGLLDKFEAPGLHLGEIEDVVHQRQQGFAGNAQGLDIGRLFRVEPGIGQQVRHPEDAVQRRPELVADSGQEARLRLVGGLGAGAGLDQRVLVGDAG